MYSYALRPYIAANDTQVMRHTTEVCVYVYGSITCVCRCVWGEVCKNTCACICVCLCLSVCVSVSVCANVRIMRLYVVRITTVPGIVFLIKGSLQYNQTSVLLRRL